MVEAEHADRHQDGNACRVVEDEHDNLNCSRMGLEVEEMVSERSGREAAKGTDCEGESAECSLGDHPEVVAASDVDHE